MQTRTYRPAQMQERLAERHRLTAFRYSSRLAGGRLTDTCKNELVGGGRMEVRAEMEIEAMTEINSHARIVNAGPQPISWDTVGPDQP